MYGVLGSARPVWAAAVIALATVGCSEPVEPVAAMLEPGRYVLSTIDGAPPPFLLTWLEREGQATVLTATSYDTITVIDDSTARQHVRQATQEQIGNAAPVEVAASEIDAVKRMLRRDDEIVLVAFGAEGPIYLVPRDGDLIRRVQIIQARCSATGACSTLSNRIVEARYVRR